ncbi:S-layer homology domain-containing protein [Peribacillus loiseleuriae]|uniref:SLH domain-containing protein n=1 Tax=Peribacillus loiseleuriae TaxID=1679170 RepID=A0A0K9H068_9BACI|nr:S-layer homology domain-containing protein [Peribacillus loiseleuriae]KMY51907.1 hypothetical protein AC625_22215 [Peribacillus loiseleuriae]
MTYQSKKHRQFFAASLTAALVATAIAPTTGFAASNFKDVQKGNFYYDFVTALANAKIIDGRPDGSFDLGGKINRAEASKMVSNILKLDSKTAPAADFSDVDQSKWYAEFINALYAKKLINGKGEGKFDPTGTLTRGEFAKMVVEAYHLTLKADGPVANFTDVDNKKWYADYVKVLYSHGLITGTTATTFSPEAQIKRADFAKLLTETDWEKGSTLEKPVAAAPSVESINAINAKQVVVKFNTVLAEGTTVAQLEAAFSLEGKQVVADTAKLSKDRKTVTYTLDNTEVSNAVVTVAPLNTVNKDKTNQPVQTAKYVSLLTYADVVAPSVSETTFANYSVDGKTANATISFTEELSTIGTVSVNGVQTTPSSTNKDSFTLNGLEVGKTYTIDIVGAKDTATPTPNKADHLTLSFTVPAKSVDSTIPTVSTSANGNKLSLTFSKEVTAGTITIGGIKVNDITTTDNKTFVVDVQKANDGSFFANNKNFFTSEVVVKDFADKAATSNKMQEVKFNSTFTADKTAASLSSASATADGKIVLDFNEDVAESTIEALTVKSIDGIMQSSKTLTVTSSKHPVVNGQSVKNKLELVLAANSQLATEKNYVVEIAKDAVVDNYMNKNANAISLNVVRPAASGVEPAAVITTTISVDKNVIDVVFANTNEDGMSDSVLTASNYKLGGKVLPSNTEIKFVDNKNKVRITLPESFVTANGNHTFIASNLTDKFGNTLATGENSVELTLTENVAPTVTPTLTVNGSNELVVSFSEAVKSEDLNKNEVLLEGITVKVNGSTVAAEKSVDAGKLKVTLTDAITASDKVTVDFNNAELTDVNGNQVTNGTASN